MSEIKKPETKDSPSLRRQRQLAGAQDTSIRDYQSAFGGMMPLIEAYVDNRLPQEDREFVEAYTGGANLSMWIQSVYAKKNSEAILHACDTIEKAIADIKLPAYGLKEQKGSAKA